MSVAVAHQVRSTSRAALREAAREAVFRNTHLAVIHVAESIDQDVTEAYKAGISDEIEKALGTPDLGDLRWELHLAAGGFGHRPDHPGAGPQGRCRAAGDRRPAALARRQGRHGQPHPEDHPGSRVPVLVMMPEDCIGSARLRRRGVVVAVPPAHPRCWGCMNRRRRHRSNPPRPRASCIFAVAPTQDGPTFVARSGVERVHDTYRRHRRPRCRRGLQRPPRQLPARCGTPPRCAPASMCLREKPMSSNGTAARAVREAASRSVAT